jgi:catechol 2,3-dioxygenase-like lactoylglutathione lyase family enzyme/ketosteroid isomerase-like protein
MSDNAAVQLVERVWAARVAGDLGPLHDALAPDAQWRAVSDGPWNCHDRDTILRVMRGNMDRGITGELEETAVYGDRIVASFRPAQPQVGSRELDDGLAYLVVTVAGGLITEIKACRTRAGAIEYARSGRAEDPGPAAVRPPAVATEPAPQRVSNLIPFVNVADVARSAAFYRHLGFVVTSEFVPHGELIWAALESEQAELMLNHTHDRIGSDGVLFFLYSNDLHALREQLIAAGVDAGEIVDGRPGPREQLELVDPDGYVLMVAQIEREDS